MPARHRHLAEHDEPRVLGSWLNRHAAIMPLATLAAAATHAGVWVAVAGAVSFAALCYANRSCLARLRPYGGYANWLTALRLVMLLLAAVLTTRVPSTWLVAIFASNVALDVADGHVARRLGQATAFGAVLDRETDALFVLVAYLHFFLAADATAWILLPGLLPYVYRLLSLRVPDLAAPDRRERLAVLLAGANYVTLVVAVAVPGQAAAAVLLVSASVVLSSFAVSFWNLYRDAYSIP